MSALSSHITPSDLATLLLCTVVGVAFMGLFISGAAWSLLVGAICGLMGGTAARLLTRALRRT